MNCPQPRRTRRAFTLVELLVVMAIIAIIIAIVLPALGGARKAAKKASTDFQLKQITNAVSAFVNDERKLPGVFSAAQMGNIENATRGMSAAENVMLDLVGFQPGSASNGIDVGPMAASTIRIDPQTIGVPGAGTKQYYSPDKKLYVPQVAGTQQMGAARHASTETDPNQLPDVIDPFGQPLLFWVQDETYLTKPSSTSPPYTFARADTSAGKAKFYWTSNACFLTATQLGKKAIDQTSASSGSMLGVNNATSVTSLAGALGSPNDPYRDPANLNGVPLVARGARAPFVVQSAGADGTYFGRRDRGAKQFMGGIIDYSVNFLAVPTDATSGYVDSNGKPTNHDIVSQFDDLISTAGN